MATTNRAAPRRRARSAPRRTYLVTVAYHAYRVSEVRVRAADPSGAGRRAIAIADADGEGWHPLDDVSESYVAALEVAGASMPVPVELSEVGGLLPAFQILIDGLATVVAIAEAGYADARVAVDQIRNAAKDALAKARP